MGRMAQPREDVIDIVFDMETGDPDDVLTLMLLAGHPKARLKAVTVTPGTRSQVGLIRWILEEFGIEDRVRVGARRWPEFADTPMPALDKLGPRRGGLCQDRRSGGGFYTCFGVKRVGDADCERAAEVLLQECDERTVLLTGGPLHNLGDALRLADGDVTAAVAGDGATADSVSVGSAPPPPPPRRRRWGRSAAATVATADAEVEGVGGCDVRRAPAVAARPPASWRLGRWVAQGGFAGVGVVSADRTIPKFAGLYECPTFNFNGDIPSAQAALASGRIDRKVLASKNVCHRVLYDEALHRMVGRVASAVYGAHALSLHMVHSSMEAYLRRRQEGKKFHDPLALSLCFDESVCSLAEVELRFKQGRWGSRLAPGSGTFISVDYDPARFVRALLGAPLDTVAPRELAEYCEVAEATW